MNISIINESDDLINNIKVNCNKNIDRLKIMIIGYNDISKELIEILKNLNCYIIISIQDKLYKEKLDKSNIRNCLIYDYLSMEIYLKNVDIVINTIDNFKLNDLYLSFINENTHFFKIRNNNKTYKKNDYSKNHSSNRY